MSTFTFRTRIARIAVAAVAAIGIAACSQAATADASVGQVTAKLTITQYKPGYHNVAVFGKVPMSQTEAQGLIDSGHRVVMRLWGDDSYSDDLLLGPYNATFYATSNGLEFHKVLIGLPDSLLASASSARPAARCAPGSRTAGTTSSRARHSHSEGPARAGPSPVKPRRRAARRPCPARRGLRRWSGKRAPRPPCRSARR